MKQASSATAHLRRLMPLVLLLALLARSAVPAGWMLSPDGALAIVPCPAWGPVASDPNAHAPAQSVHGHDHHEGHHSKPAEYPATGTGSQPCPYAAFPSQGLLPDPPMAGPTPPPAFAETRFAADTPSRRFGLPAPPPPATGPPRLS